MKLRMGLFDLSKGTHIPLKPCIRIVCGDDMDLLGAIGYGIVGDLQHLFMAHRIGIGVFACRRIGTELADICTDIGRVQVTVDIEITLPAVLLFPYRICQFTQRIEVKVIECFTLFLI